MATNKTATLGAMKMAALNGLFAASGVVFLKRWDRHAWYVNTEMPGGFWDVLPKAVAPEIAGVFSHLEVELRCG